MLFTRPFEITIIWVSKPGVPTNNLIRVSSLDGAVGFTVRDPELYVVKARAAVRAHCGATDLWRPHAVGEGFIRGRRAFGPRVDHNGLKSG